VWILFASACLEARPPAAQGCSDCHGSATSSAPPTALGGATERSARGVGAHEVHLLGSELSAPVACAECHLLPAAVDAEGHVDTPYPAEVTWANGALAKEGAEPFDAEGQTCVVYCHGATFDQGASPPWTDTEGLGCASCHGFPPPAPHPDDSSCATCHTNVSGSGFADPALHVDGVVQLDAGTIPTTGETGTTIPESCTGCHGAGDNPAPPPDTSGSSDTTRTSVGAHEAHVLGTATSAPVPCAECHLTYTSSSDPGHFGPESVVFGAFAARPPHAPVWNGSTCADTACHAFGGGAFPEPAWTTVDGSQVACDGCHSLPPPNHPPAGQACGSAGCHPSVANPGTPPTIRDPALHANGRLEF
jgi:predicted CxxxxCH...CXXCH cytochrome family protein